MPVKSEKGEEGFANLLEGLMYVLAREAMSLKIYIVSEIINYLEELNMEITNETEDNVEKENLPFEECKPVDKATDDLLAKELSDNRAQDGSPTE